MKDSDFFLTENEADLSLVGVSVPTYLIFALAPALGAMLYAYLHSHLLVLWQALGAAPFKVNGTPLSDRLTPWLTNDFALSLRRDGALSPRPARWLASSVTFVFIFLAAPMVLAAFWWRSMPAHDEVLTVIGCGLPFSLSLYIGLRSFHHMRHSLKEPGSHRPWRRRRGAVLIVLSLAIAVLGWIRTEGTLGWYAEQYFGYDYDELKTLWWAGTPYPDFLSKADLSFVNFVNTPPDWQDYADAKAAFYRAYCAEYGLPKLACAYSNPGEAEAARVARERESWCATHLAEGACPTFFQEFDTRRTRVWQQTRATQITQLTKRDFRYADLRGANLREARMERAILTAARMERADLSEARMEGADLYGTQMDESTSLWGTVFEGASLRAIDFTTVQISAEQVASAFGDDSTVLPPHIPRPEHWPEAELDWYDLPEEWLKWQADPQGYTPP